MSRGRAESRIRLFLCGDVMLGRGIDQILSHPCDPTLHEEFVHSALTYVELAERVSGPIPRRAGNDYIWGDALSALDRAAVDARIINLETSITTSPHYAAKGIHYRMNPRNIGCLAAARIDCCVLANNHVLDWGTAGLIETLESLEAAGIHYAGAGRNAASAAAPAILATRKGARVLVYGFGVESSGIPSSWTATADQPGVNLLPDLSEGTAEGIARRAAPERKPGDILVASIHWGPNWGYEIPPAQRTFARRLLDWGFSAVHGHSSHHAKAIEVYRDRLILYGCGDFLTDYEGIGGYETFRGDLALMYLPELSPADGRLVALEIVPFRLSRFRLERASAEDAAWLQRTLDRESAPFGTRVSLGADDHLSVLW